MTYSISSALFNFFLSRSSNAFNSSSDIAFAKDIIVIRCVTVPKFSIGCAPILWVGDSGTINSGYFFSINSSSFNNLSYSLSEIIGLSNT